MFICDWIVDYFCSVENTQMESFYLDLQNKQADHASSLWNSRTVSILLPANTKYSKGILKTTQDGVSLSTPDPIESNGHIPVPFPGEVPIQIAATYSSYTRSRTVLKTAHLAVHFFEKGMSPEDYLKQIKSKSCKILSESNDSLIEITQELLSFGVGVKEYMEKTMIKDDLVVKIRVSLGYEVDDEQDKMLLSLFKKIQLT